MLGGGYTSQDRIRNVIIIEKVRVIFIVEKMIGSCLICSVCNH
jgi:hypothetical protein